MFPHKSHMRAPQRDSLGKTAHLIKLKYNMNSCVAGKAIFLHHQHRELDLQSEDVVPPKKLHEQMRARVHRDRRTHQALCLYGLLRD